MQQDVIKATERSQAAAPDGAGRRRRAAARGAHGGRRRHAGAGAARGRAARQPSRDRGDGVEPRYRLHPCRPGRPRSRSTPSTSPNTGCCTARLLSVSADAMPRDRPGGDARSGRTRPAPATPMPRTWSMPPRVSLDRTMMDVDGTACQPDAGHGRDGRDQDRLAPRHQLSPVAAPALPPGQPARTLMSANAMHRPAGPGYAWAGAARAVQQGGSCRVRDGSHVRKCRTKTM